ncbi:MAG TPA: GTPase HflX, partial [Aeromicrobium sp.]|nr:GTPase HflX [Aeromicrobium sp.]
HSVVCSARTGEGIEGLLAAIERDLPQPKIAIDVVIPYERGDLVNQIHLHGDIDSVEHTADGTHVMARVNDDLAGALESYGA